MHVLVVIPVFNRRTLVNKALDSVAAQTRHPSAVVVVDDGSTDDTAAIVSAWIQAHPQIPAHMISTPNQGASAARNLAVARMGPGMDAVAFLDSDDCWPEDFIDRACLALDSRADAVAASTDRAFLRLGKATMTVSSLAEITPNPWLWMIRYGAGISSCTLFRLSAVQAAGGYPEDIPTGHDCVLFGRIAAQGSWLHLPGRPTMFLQASHSGDSSHEGHLHSRYDDYLTWWAKATHQLWLEAPPDVRANRRGRRDLSKRWRSAALSAHKRRQHSDARFCLDRAIGLRPWIAANWWLWLQALFWRQA